MYTPANFSKTQGGTRPLIGRGLVRGSVHFASGTVVLFTAMIFSLCFPCVGQTRLFEGFSGGLKLSAGGLKEKYNPDRFTHSQADFTSGSSVQAQYGLSLGPRLVMGFGAVVSVADYPTSSASAGSSLKYKAANQYTINFEPGYTLTPNALVYGKLAYHNLDDGLSGVPQATTSMLNLSGVGYGLGIRSMLTPSIYVQFEYQQLDFDKYNHLSTDLKLNNNQSSIHLGYKF